MSTINIYYTDSYKKTPFTVPYLETKQSTIEKIANFLLPKNELTGQRIFRFTLLYGHARGWLDYNLECLFYKTLKDPELNKEVQSIFNQLVTQTKRAYPSTKNLSWEIRIKKDPTVNAFCYPGGKILITTGMLETLKTRISIENKIFYKDLIASILAHEIIHGVAEHYAVRFPLILLGNKIEKALICLILSLANPVPLIQLALREQYLTCLIQAEETTSKYLPEALSQYLSEGIKKYLENSWVITILMNLSIYFFLYSMVRLLFDTLYIRSQELEADKYGIFLANAAGYKPEAILSGQGMFMALEGEENKPKGWFKRIQGLTNTHPSHQIRFEENRKTISMLDRKSMLGKKEKID